MRHCEVCGEQVKGVRRIEVHSREFEPRRDVCEVCEEVFRAAVRRAFRMRVLGAPAPEEE